MTVDLAFKGKPRWKVLESFSTRELLNDAKCIYIENIPLKK